MWIVVKSFLSRFAPLLSIGAAVSFFMLRLVLGAKRAERMKHQMAARDAVIEREAREDVLKDQLDERQAQRKQQEQSALEAGKRNHFDNDW